MSCQRTKEECIEIISGLGNKFGVPPKLIAKLMLSDLDKSGMLSGEINIEALEAYTEDWKARGMPDYSKASGNFTGIVKTGFHRLISPRSSDCHYRLPFFCSQSRADCHCRAMKS